MKSKQTIIGLVIFIIVTMLLFITFTQLFDLSDSISALAAIAMGILAEVVYRKRK